LIAHPDARGVLEGDLAVWRRFAEVNSELAFEGLGYVVATIHGIDDVVAEANNQVAPFASGEEGVEGDEALDFYTWSRDQLGNEVDHGVIHEAFLGMDRSHDVHEPGAITVEFRANALCGVLR
jgi:hypothetical protein